MTPLLAVNGLHAWYGAAHILHGVDLEVGRGEVVALMGRNGAGKSTTLKSIMGLVERRQGEVSFMERPIQGLRPFEIARRGLAYVPEDRRIFADLSVRDNLQTGRQPARRWPDGTAAPAWTEASLEALFPNLAGTGARAAGSLSGGEQQMLTVARSLMGNPFAILLDEPSEGVAPIVVEQMARSILELKARGCGILLSEQNLHFAQWVSDRVVILEKGAVRFRGSMEQLAADPSIARSFLGV